MRLVRLLQAFGDDRWKEISRHQSEALAPIQAQLRAAGF